MGWLPGEAAQGGAENQDSLTWADDHVDVGVRGALSSCSPHPAPPPPTATGFIQKVGGHLLVCFSPPEPSPVTGAGDAVCPPCPSGEGQGDWAWPLAPKSQLLILSLLGASLNFEFCLFIPFPLLNAKAFLLKVCIPSRSSMKIINVLMTHLEEVVMSGHTGDFSFPSISRSHHLCLEKLHRTGWAAVSGRGARINQAPTLFQACAR